MSKAASPEPSSETEAEALLDEALEESFPAATQFHRVSARASPSITTPKSSGRPNRLTANKRRSIGLATARRVWPPRTLLLSFP